jgi:hypothetical protein
MVHGDVKEDPDGGEADDEARPTVRDERKRHTGERRKAHHGAHIDGRLTANERGEPGGQALAERIAAADGDVEPGVGEERECGDDSQRADEAKLLADDREDHVGRGFRQVVDLLDALTETHTEDPT